ncbi:MAG: type II toxin-antitoxin system VapC family toxin [Nitrospinota bacterium]
MILYLDTSSLVKLYIEEPHSSKVRGWVDEAEIVAVCRIAYPETVSALHRRFRSGDLPQNVYTLLTDKFSNDWKRLASIDFDERQAGDLAAKHELRGFDAVHLSAALLIKKAGTDIHLAFSSFDHKLNNAALQEGLQVLTA